MRYEDLMKMGMKIILNISIPGFMTSTNVIVRGINGCVMHGCENEIYLK